MALAGDDAANQAIAIGTRVLNDGLRVVARAKSQVAQVNLESFGGVTVISPFETFATNLALDLGSPEVLRLEEWLTSAPGSECPSRINVPRGTWVLVGFGRFGRAIAEVLDRAGISWTAIDSDQALPEQERLLAGDNTEKVLRDAGIAAADVLVAGTDVDAVNLGVTTLARRVNADLFVVIRQNDVNDSILIQAAKADLRFVQADLVVHECLQELKTPMLGRFLLRARSEGGAFAARAIERISDSVGTGSPRAWTFHCDVMQPGIFGAFFQNPGESLPLRLLCRDVSAPDHALRVTPLMVERRAETLLLPGPEVELKPGDRVLFVGDDFARRVQQRYLMEPGAIEWVRSGVEPPRSWVFRRLMRRRLARTEQ
ncbi:MAG: NAD-binding protein [Burkholderiaceae bacterium]